jgi:hypothetical protein
VQALFREYELLGKYPRVPDALSAHPSSSTGIPVLRQQYTSFVKLQPPFNAVVPGSTDEYWQQMLLSTHASVLAVSILCSKYRFAYSEAVYRTQTPLYHAHRRRRGANNVDLHPAQLCESGVAKRQLSRSHDASPPALSPHKRCRN